MKISIWKTMGVNPITDITYHVIIDPMKEDTDKLQYSTESKFGMYWFIVKNFTKLYIDLMKGDKEFIANSIEVSEQLKAKDIEVSFVKKPHYRKKYKKSLKNM